jgi:aspartyl-tRNA(Asn)/glutamyl-tRNA(Gln) amidotransferase subunit C
MTEKNITVKDVEHVAKLARVAISPEEIQRYQEQLERILDYIGKLKTVDTAHVPAASHPYEVSNVWRDDVAKPFPYIPDLFKNAPESEENFFKVKKVIE